MGVVHFLNVKDGDCIWIKHLSDHNTIIDVCNAKIEELKESESRNFAHFQSGGNHRQKEHPVNPISYLESFGVGSIFRFILTHPDMDHMDGIKALFDSFSVINFWDTDNNKVIENFTDRKYSKEDWDYYQEIRKRTESPIVLHLYSGSTGQYYNQNEDGSSGADGLYILAPTKHLVEEANKTGDYNDCSYVILYRTGSSKKVLFAGDSGEKTWEFILENHKEDVKNIDVLIAPHHGRKTGGNDDYLDLLNPKLTLFGNAESKDLDYSSWSRRGLDYITNNQANCVILDTDDGDIKVYATYETFAKKVNPNTTYNTNHKAWYLGSI